MNNNNNKIQLIYMQIILPKIKVIFEESKILTRKRKMTSSHNFLTKLNPREILSI